MVEPRIQINWKYEVDYCDAKIFCPGNVHPWVMANIKGPDPKQTEAYARLIATAPDLLEALLAILPHIPKSTASEGGPNARSAHVAAADKVRAAIAKAKG